MKGNVLGFDPDTNTGAISGYDGQRYDFVTAEWRGVGRPRRGDLVDFQAVDQRATEIYLVEAVYVQPGFWPFYFSLNGRISRSQYWLRFVVPYIVIYFTLQIVGAIAGSDSNLYIAIAITIYLFSLVMFWPSIAILVKRIHDRNKSGWWSLFLYVPTVVLTILLVVWLGTAIVAIAAGGADAALPALGGLGIAAIVMAVITFGIDIWFFVEFGCLRGTIGSNRFGPDPVRRR
jgi:uncharacterized membrane protein YhaH (DUF805 family)